MRRSFLIALISASVGSAYGQAEYPGAQWFPAHSGNQTSSNRPTTYPINYVVLHLAQGYYNGTISWFQNDASNVSAHYVVRSSDGQVAQMVLHKNIAWHAGNWTYNTQSVGIEHEGFFTEPQWFTAAMYKSSSDLVYYITNRHGIPRDRTRVIAHREVPGGTTQCPGDLWNWTYFMDNLRNRATFAHSSWPTTMSPGQLVNVSIRMNNTGDDAWSNAGGGQVRLATQNPPNRVSPFFVQGNWISSSRPAAPAATTVNAGQLAEFNFKVRAPMSPGSYSESFQLHKDSIGFFGPIFTLNIQINATGQVVDNSDPSVAYQGAWNTGTTAAGLFGTDYRWTNTSSAETHVARYYIPRSRFRELDVWAWWSQGTNRSTQAKYVLDGGDMMTKPRTVTVNQQVNGGQWNYLGRMRLGDGGGYVGLSNQAPPGFVVIADAIRYAPVR